LIEDEKKIEIEKVVNPLATFESEVVRSGNGAVIKSFKKFRGKKAYVIILDK